MSDNAKFGLKLLIFSILAILLILFIGSVPMLLDKAFPHIPD